MAQFIDEENSLLVLDTQRLRSYLGEIPAASDLEKNADDLLMSASGWRKTFLADGKSVTKDILLSALVARSFLDYVKKTKSKDDVSVVLGIDTRPSGPILAEACLSVLLAGGAKPRYLFICAAPEIMAYTRAAEADAFLYISASHNPLEYNGFKFGFGTGGVLKANEAQELADRTKALFGDRNLWPQLAAQLSQSCEESFYEVFEKQKAFKKQALKAYQSHLLEVFSLGKKGEDLEKFILARQENFERKSFGILAELNGSARTLSVDKALLLSLGVKVRLVNAKPGEIVHDILPEGPSLNQAADELEKLHAQDPDYVLAYVPDNDGDRGNFVYIDEKTGKAKRAEAQEVFALCCLSELCFLVAEGLLRYDDQGKALEKVALVANDATSLRIEEIASVFDVQVFRSEVGEANAVDLAEALRKKGYLVRILGEGSNGGSIIHPSRVRDPLNTVLSLLRFISPDSQGATLSRLWFDKRKAKSGNPASLTELIASLPVYQTTTNYDKEAVLSIQVADHAALKANYERHFLEFWEKNRDELRKKAGLFAWEEINYEGTQEFRGLGRNFRTGKEKGGFKILFKDDRGNPRAFLWMRGSGTEPVFRLMVDLKGNDGAFVEFLLGKHREMVLRSFEELGTRD